MNVSHRRRPLPAQHEGDHEAAGQEEPAVERLHRAPARKLRQIVLGPRARPAARVPGASRADSGRAPGRPGAPSRARRIFVHRYGREHARRSRPRRTRASRCTSSTTWRPNGSTMNRVDHHAEHAYPCHAPLRPLGRNDPSRPDRDGLTAKMPPAGDASPADGPNFGRRPIAGRRWDARERADSAERPAGVRVTRGHLGRVPRPSIRTDRRSARPACRRKGGPAWAASGRAGRPSRRRSAPAGTARGRSRECGRRCRPTPAGAWRRRAEGDRRAAPGRPPPRRGPMGDGGARTWSACPGE